MISRKELRATCKKHLQAHIKDIPIEYLPANWKEYRITDSNGVVLIDYVGTRASEASGRQQVTVTNISLYLCLKDHFNTDDQLELLDKLRITMTNDLFINGFRFAFQGDQRLGSEDGIWYWQIDFSLTGIIYIGE